VFAGREGFWKYEVDEPCEPLDPRPIGEGMLYRTFEENLLLLQRIMGETAKEAETIGRA